MPRTYSATQIVYRAYRHIAGHRAGQGVSPDIAADAANELNDMMDEWTGDENFIFAKVPILFPLSAGVQIYTIGPGGAFNVADVPAGVDNANIVINTTAPVTRKELEIVTSSDWSRISVVDIPFAIPTKLWFDGNCAPATGMGKIYLWPGPLSAYQLELFVWQSLPNFPDMTTTVVFAPGYASAIIWSLAERIAPMMKIYFKIPEPLLAQVSAQAALARMRVQGRNVADLMSEIDPSFLGSSGDWNYLTGEK